MLNSYNFNEHIVKKYINKYDGAGRKESVLLDDGNKYLLKLPDPTREKHLQLSYINNTISEYLGCKIIKEIGLPVQDVIIGEYTSKSLSNKTEKTYIACACRDFETDGYSLAKAEDTSLESDVDTKEAVLPSFFTLSKIALYIPDISEEEIREFYANQFVVDAFIGNKDRHNGNWGFLTGDCGNKISPIYDCGSSLCSLYAESELTEKTAISEAYNGISAIRDEENRQIEYRSYLLSASNEDVNAAMKRIVPKINMNRINQIIDDTPYISDERKKFYKTFLDTKYQKVLLPALAKILELDIKYDKNMKIPENVYSIYSDVIKPWTEFPLFEKSVWEINGQIREICRVSNKYILFIDPVTQSATDIIVSRSNNKDAFDSLKRLSAAYAVDINDLKNKIVEQSIYVKSRHR